MRTNLSSRHLRGCPGTRHPSCCNRCICVRGRWWPCDARTLYKCKYQSPQKSPFISVLCSNKDLRLRLWKKIEFILLRIHLWKCQKSSDYFAQSSALVWKCDSSPHPPNTCACNLCSRKDDPDMLGDQACFRRRYRFPSLAEVLHNLFLVSSISTQSKEDN